MIVPEIRYFLSADIEDLETYAPEDPDRFAFALDMMIGPAGAEGEEQFEVQVATPEWLKERYGPNGVISGRHLLVTFGYDWPRIAAYLREQVESCSAETWSDVATKLSRFAHWEFEDYTAS
jgi:hypothetical protein